MKLFIFLCAVSLSASAAIEKRSILVNDGQNTFSRNYIVADEPCEDNIVLDQPTLINNIPINTFEPFIPAVQNIVRDVKPIISTPIIEQPTFVAPPVVVEEPCEEPAKLLPSRESIVIPPVQKIINPVTSFSYSTFEPFIPAVQNIVRDVKPIISTPIIEQPIIAPPVVVEEPCEEPAILLPSRESIVIPPVQKIINPVTSFSYSTFEPFIPAVQNIVRDVKPIISTPIIEQPIIAPQVVVEEPCEEPAILSDEKVFVQPPPVEFKPTVVETKLLPRPVNVAPVTPIGAPFVATSETIVEDVVKDLKPIVLEPIKLPDYAAIPIMPSVLTRPLKPISLPVKNIVQDINTVVYDTQKLVIDEPCIEPLEPIIPPVQHIVRDFKPIVSPLEIIRPPVQNIVKDFVVQTPKLFTPTEVIRPPVQNIVRDSKPIIVETPKLIQSPIVASSIVLDEPCDDQLIIKNTGWI